MSHKITICSPPQEWWAEGQPGKLWTCTGLFGLSSLWCIFFWIMLLFKKDWRIILWSIFWFIYRRLLGETRSSNRLLAADVQTWAVLCGCRGRCVHNQALSVGSAQGFRSMGHWPELKQKSGVYQRSLITFLLFGAGGLKPSQLVIGRPSENPLSARWYDACSSVTGKPINNGIGCGPLRNSVPMASFSPVNGWWRWLIAHMDEDGPIFTLCLLRGASGPT